MAKHGDWKDLFKASGEGNYNLVRYHLGQGSDPNFQHPEYFTCPIFEAIRGGHLHIVKLLVEEGNANVNDDFVEDLTNSNVIEVALEERQHDIVDYLLTKIKKPGWKPKQVLVVTEGSSIGTIGLDICTNLLHQGHCVVFTCSSTESGCRVVEELKTITRNHKVDFIVGTLHSIPSTQHLARSILAKFPTLNVLMMNSHGRIWPIEKRINDNGLERSFMTHYFAPYILCRALQPQLQKNGPSRILLGTTELYHYGKPDIVCTPYGNDFSSFRTYANTAYCNVLFVQWFAKKLLQESEGSHKNVTINSIHLGGMAMIETSLFLGDGCLGLVLRFLQFIWLLVVGGGNSSSSTLTTTLATWLATSPEVDSNVNGNCFFEKGKKQDLLPSVLNETTQNEWMQWTEDLINRN